MMMEYKYGYCVSRYHFICHYITCVLIYFLNVEMSVCCPLHRLRRKVSLAKGKSISSDIGILYPTPKISNPNLNFKLCWRKILLLEPRNYFLLTPTWILLGIGDSRRFLWGICLCFPHWGLLHFYLLGELHSTCGRCEISMVIRKNPSAELQPNKKMR